MNNINNNNNNNVHNTDNKKGNIMGKDEPMRRFVSHRTHTNEDLGVDHIFVRPEGTLTLEELTQEAARISRKSSPKTPSTLLTPSTLDSTHKSATQSDSSTTSITNMTSQLTPKTTPIWEATDSSLESISGTAYGIALERQERQDRQERDERREQQRMISFEEQKQNEEVYAELESDMDGIDTMRRFTEEIFADTRAYRSEEEEKKKRRVLLLERSEKEKEDKQREREHSEKHSPPPPPSDILMSSTLSCMPLSTSSPVLPLSSPISSITSPLSIPLCVASNTLTNTMTNTMTNSMTNSMSTTMTTTMANTLLFFSNSRVIPTSIPLDSWSADFVLSDHRPVSSSIILARPSAKN